MAGKTRVTTCGRDLYRQAANQSPHTPLWQSPWWLDITAEGRWDAVCVISGGEVVAALPYVSKQRYGLSLWGQPPLTQSLGPWLAQIDDAKYERRLSREHALLTDLVSAIPKGTAYMQSWQPARSNWLPFHWAGFGQTTRYTYRIELAGKAESQLWEGLSKGTRWEVRKATNRHGIYVTQEDDVGVLLDLNEAVFARQGMSLPYSRDFVSRMHGVAQSRAASSLWVARGSGARALAVAYVVRDGQTAYYIIGGADPELRNTGAQNLVVWEAIRNEIGKSQVFDFEGSMIRGIERSFRSYGAVQVPYFAVRGAHSRWLSAATEMAAWRLSLKQRGVSR